MSRPAEPWIEDLSAARVRVNGAGLRLVLPPPMVHRSGADGMPPSAEREKAFGAHGGSAVIDCADPSPVGNASNPHPHRFTTLARTALKFDFVFDEEPPLVSSHAPGQSAQQSLFEP